MSPGFTIAARFCGPPNSGNGGYVAGRLAAFVASDGEPVEVTLRSPPPLGVHLDVVQAADGEQRLQLQDTLIAQAHRADLDGEQPPPLPFAIAREATRRYLGREGHPFPTCFVCGPQRAPGDGLRLQPGAVEGYPVPTVATPWQPDETLAAADWVEPEFVWAALDCPGGWSSDLNGRPMVLGRMTARVHALPRVGEPCVVVGQLLGLQGRKAFSASALFGDGDRLLGHARATWLQVDPAAVRPALL